MKIVRHPNIVRLNEVFHKRAYNFLCFITCMAVFLKLLQNFIFYVTRFRLLIHILIMQVLAGRTKIYIILELITGGELFDRIVREAYPLQHCQLSILVASHSILFMISYFYCEQSQ
jgi:serine/threonine protein kinase